MYVIPEAHTISVYPIDVQTARTLDFSYTVCESFDDSILYGVCSLTRHGVELIKVLFVYRENSVCK